MGLLNFQPFVDPGPIARDDILRTMDAIADQALGPRRVCPHLVSPRALYSPGTYICVDCGQSVEIEIPLSEMVSSDGDR